LHDAPKARKMPAYAAPRTFSRNDCILNGYSIPQQ